MVNCACRKFLEQGVACLNVPELRKPGVPAADLATIQLLVPMQQEWMAAAKSKLKDAILSSMKSSGESSSSSGSESGEISSGDESRYVTSHNFEQL